MNQPKLLIVEDDEDVRTQMKWALAQDYSVFLAGDRSSAMVLVAREQPAVVTLDLGLPPRPADVEEGFATLSEILSADSHVKVIIITGRGEKEHALRAVGEGAYDFLYKPVEIDELKIVLKRAFYVSSLEREHRHLKKQFTGNSFEEMLGTSPRDAGSLYHGSEGGDNRCTGPDHGRERHGKRARGPRHPPAQSTKR